MSSGVMKLFAKRIKQIRKRYGLSQEAMAELCGVDSSYVGRLERLERTPSLDTLGRMAEGLGVQVHELVDFSKELVIEKLK